MEARVGEEFSRAQGICENRMTLTYDGVLEEQTCEPYRDPIACYLPRDKYICARCLQFYVGKEPHVIITVDEKPIWTPVSSLSPDFLENPAKENWYFLLWTHDEDHTIEEVRANLDRFAARRVALGLIACDIVLEHGEVTNREHYHMRIKTTIPLKRNRLLAYLKCGDIKIRFVKDHTEYNWNKLTNYMSKENKIEKLI